MITAVRLRLLPAPEAAIRAGRVPARRARRLRGDRRCSRPACARRCSTSSTARTLGDRRRRPIPAGGAAAECRLRADRRGRRQRGGGAARSATSSWSCSASGALGDRTSRPSRRRCGAGATASTRRSPARAAAKVSEDIVVPIERLGEGARAASSDRRAPRAESCSWGHAGEGNVHATVLVDPRREAELDAAEAVGEELFELVGSSSAVDRRRARRRAGSSAGAWRASGAGGPSSCTSRSSAPSTRRGSSTREEAGEVACAVAGAAATPTRKGFADEQVAADRGGRIKDSGLTKADSARALESLLGTVTKTLKKGDEVASPASASSRS